MNIHNILQLGKNNDISVFFGEADNEEEKNEIYRLRYSVYSKKKYIDENRYSNMSESDVIDGASDTVHFIAVVKHKNYTKVIGYIRLIKNDVLPTQRYFIFSEPEEMKKISKYRKFEIGRFVIIPPDKKNNFYLPRGLVRLFLLHTIAEYASTAGLEGGYAFIKKTLDQKLKKNNFPIHYIHNYILNYPRDGILYNYFNQNDDPVFPIYFFTNEVKLFTNRKLNNKFLFKRNNRIYIFSTGLICNILKLLKII